MKKYKLINTTTKEEHLCDKVTIDGFDYYVTNDEISENDYYVVPHNIEGKILSQNFVLGMADKNFMVNYYINTMKDWRRKVIATNNQNIDITKVVDVIEGLAIEYLNDNYGYVWDKGDIDNFKYAYNKSQEMFPFTEEDMIEFAEWCQKPCLEDLRQPNVVYISSGNFYWYKHKKYTPKELLQLWKERNPKKVYYEN